MRSPLRLARPTLRVKASPESFVPEATWKKGKPVGRRASVLLVTDMAIRSRGTFLAKRGPPSSLVGPRVTLTGGSLTVMDASLASTARPMTLEGRSESRKAPSVPSTGSSVDDEGGVVRVTRELTDAFRARNSLTVLA
jgi:hypothetical protein